MACIVFWGGGSGVCVRGGGREVNAIMIANRRTGDVIVGGVCEDELYYR